MLNIRKLLKDYGIPHRQGSSTWINIQCPFCCDSSYHGGFDTIEVHYCCLKCGYHHMNCILEIIIGNDYRKTVIAYDQDQTYEVFIQNKYDNKELTLPFTPRVLQEEHRQYLVNRGYDPDELIELWDIGGYQDNYSSRIMIPITSNGRIVSYQGRDITGMNRLKYLTCSSKLELKHHKHVLYGLDLIQDKCNTAIVVEGVFDVWRLGIGSVATFGIQYTKHQVLLLAKRFSKVLILFDTDTNAKRQALKLALELLGLGVKVRIVTLRGCNDPGDLTKIEGRELMASLTRLWEVARTHCCTFTT